MFPNTSKERQKSGIVLEFDAVMPETHKQNRGTQCATHRDTHRATHRETHQNTRREPVAVLYLVTTGQRSAALALFVVAPRPNVPSSGQCQRVRPATGRRRRANPHGRGAS